jgi:hypothetical protein
VNAASSEKTFMRIQKERLNDENHYVNVPRDAFICYSSKNKLIVQELVNYLESEGIKCWYSNRNLRPEGASQYWYDIEKAMIETKLIIVISSEYEMLSPDVRKEIELAKIHQKTLIEFKIDLIPHNVYFKHTFDGIQWINGYDDIYQGFNKVKTVIDLKLRDQRNNTQKNQTMHFERKSFETKREFLMILVLLFFIPFLLIFIINRFTSFNSISDIVSNIIS